VLISIVLAVAACQGTPSPDTVVQRVFTALSRHAAEPQAGELRDTYELLSAASRAHLERRAAEIGLAQGGEPPRPWQALASSGLAAGNRIGKVEIVGGDPSTGKVQVRVHFEWAIPVSQGGPPDDPPPATVEVVEEDGQWRVVLWE
jgi:hypothetical protein